jgi:hypothetical protein
MLTTYDLRTGNWVGSSDSKLDYRVISLEQENIGVESYKNSYQETWPDELNWENIEPIPLTNEWFMRIQDFIRIQPLYTLVQFETFQVGQWGDGRYKLLLDSRPCSGMPIEYVHQLQNLHYAISGKELKLKAETGKVPPDEDGNEFRLGNLVTFKSDGQKWNQTVNSVLKRGRVRVQGDHKYSPILLSNEVLNKMGIPDGRLYHQSLADEAFYHLVKDTSKGYNLLWNEGQINRIDIEYVHQLQNLFYALTGSELQTGGL